VTLLRRRYTRLEGWPRVPALDPSFETHRFAMLLRMRAAFAASFFAPCLEVERRGALGRQQLPISGGRKSQFFTTTVAPTLTRL
jgi:hypothetical protein